MAIAPTEEIDDLPSVRFDQLEPEFVKLDMSLVREIDRSELNLDHVIPRAQGGTSTWENVVCSCLRCNRQKGGRSPDEAGMNLLRRPMRPNWTPFVLETWSLRRHREWLPFLSTVDAAYWNTELVDR